MKTSTFLKRILIVFAFIFLVFSTIQAIEPFEAPDDEEWMLYSFEENSEWDNPYFAWFSEYGFSYSIIENPYPDNVNASSKSLQASKSSPWNNFAPFSNDRGYFDLTQWEKIAVDIMPISKNITQYKIGLCINGGFDEIAKVEVGWGEGELDLPINEWHTIEWDIRELISDSTINSTTKVNAIRITPNFQGDALTLCVDNYRLLRTKSPVTELNKEEVESNLYYNKNSETFTLSNANGKLIVYNLSGCIMTEIAEYAGEEIAVNNYSNGVYIVKIDNNTFKLIK